MLTAEEFYKNEKLPEFDKFDKKIAKFDYYDMIDFAESYAKNLIRENKTYIEKDMDNAYDKGVADGKKQTK